MATQPAEITRLMDNARQHLPGALDASLKLEFFNVIDEFLKKTNFWQEDIDFVVRAGRYEYELAGTEPGFLFNLISTINRSLVPVKATMPTLGTLKLAADPVATETLTAKVAYTVVDPMGTDDYPQIPDTLLFKYGAGIMEGIVGRMMLQPAKPYTNQQLGILHTRTFGVAVAQACKAVRHENIQGGQRWRFPRFAAGHQRR